MLPFRACNAKIYAERVSSSFLCGPIEPTRLSVDRIDAWDLGVGWSLEDGLLSLLGGLAGSCCGGGIIRGVGRCGKSFFK